MAVALGSSATVTLESLIRIKHKSIKEFELKARGVAAYAMENKKYYEVFRIAKELQELYCDVDDMQDFIISTRDPFYLFKFAREIRTADVLKLEQAIIDSGDLNYIAKFACFVDGANIERLENIIVGSDNPRAAYIYLKFGKHPNAQRVKSIFLRSKKPRYLYALAQLINDPDDLEEIQQLIISSKSNMYVRLFAANIPGANLSLLEDRILKTKNFEEIKKFAKVTKSTRLNKIILLM
jgi:hypothetical protein